MSNGILEYLGIGNSTPTYTPWDATYNRSTIVSQPYQPGTTPRIGDYTQVDMSKYNGGDSLFKNLTSSDKIDLGLGGMQLGLGLANYFNARDQQKLNKKIAKENIATSREQAALQKMSLGDKYAVAGSMSQALGAKDNPYKDQIERLRSGERLV